ncbi:MAG TPA: TonB-dependent receptor [Gemmatimonadaceae bacterium]|nr:TonB-dependent receptor [Gemmatimonadaceae bacterium]
MTASYSAHRSTLILAKLAALLMLLAAPLYSQEARTGRIVGRVIDAEGGMGLPDVGVQLVGTTKGTQSGVDGRFTLVDVPAGTVTLQVRRLGFQPKTVTGIVLAAGATVEQNVAMSAATVTLQATVVTASAERGTVNEALDAQRTATGIVNAVTSEQIARSPDGDAGQAMQRVSGVTVQDGRYVFVRGLGERYTTTQLNGTRVPSPDPEKRVVPFDMFPSGLLQSVTATKTFTPDLQGDFSGAQVDIRTREFPVHRQVTMGLSVGANASGTASDLLAARGVGGERFALAGSARNLPSVFRRVGNFQGITLTQQDQNMLVSQFRNAWTPDAGRGTPNTSFQASVGGNDPVLGQRIGYLLSGTYSLSQEVKAGAQRALADRGSTPGSTNEIDRFDGEAATSSVLWGGLANFSTLLGGHSRLSFDNTYTRTADNEARRERGEFENEGIAARIDRMRYVERAVMSSQLSGEHQLGARHKFEWAATGSQVTRDEPDRSEFVRVIERDTPDGPEVLRWLNTGNGGAVRTFSTLDETSWQGKADYQLEFNAFGGSHRFKTGGYLRTTERDADTRAYSISAPTASAEIRELPPELIFDGRFAGAHDAVFSIAPLSQGGAYSADDRLSAGYAMVELSLGSRLRLITGARYERDRLEVDATSTLGEPVNTSRNWSDVLPSAALNVAITPSQNLRLSWSGTLARPEYRELSPIKSRDVLNGDDLEGNPNLDRTRIRNSDVRWEWYPADGELLSLGVFAKQFDKPIERVYRAAGSSSRFIGYVNARSADNYGVELEARKRLGFLASSLEQVSAFTNVTVMQSEIDLGEAQAAATNRKRRMVGQAPYVVNAGLTWSSWTGDGSATLLYNRVGERIDAAGDLPLPDVVLRPRDQLDLSLRFPLPGGLSGRADARNVFDSPHKTVQGTVVRDAWRSGRIFQFGLQWQPR